MVLKIEHSLVCASESWVLEGSRDEEEETVRRVLVVLDRLGFLEALEKI